MEESGHNLASARGDGQKRMTAMWGAGRKDTTLAGSTSVMITGLTTIINYWLSTESLPKWERSRGRFTEL
jgi:hypothetical protein